MLPYFASFILSGMLAYAARDARLSYKFLAWAGVVLAPLGLASALMQANAASHDAINAVAIAGPVGIFSYPMVWYWLERNK